MQSVTVSPDGKHVYAASFNDDAVDVFSRNATGTLVFVEVVKDGDASRRDILARTAASRPSGMRH